MNYFIVISLWAFFGWQHSYLARPFFKERIKKYLGISFEKYFYRFFYFISQCIVFYFCYDIIKSVDPGKPLFKVSENYIWTIYLLNKISNIFLIITVFHFDIGRFIGVSDMLNFFYKKKYSDELNNYFLYRYIRHPMYLAIIFTYLFSTSIYTPVFFVNLLCIIIYVEIGLYYEEKTLIKVFKKKYIDYRKKTFRYVPFIR
jgi:protein-S-isoprenylcysteine O-methyltransferase Ste14|tara:strand:+ start:239 stop:841 length:603 start_codon:yes stop_codon:yes gene_type:complete